MTVTIVTKGRIIEHVITHFYLTINATYCIIIIKKLTFMPEHQQFEMQVAVK